MTPHDYQQQLLDAMEACPLLTAFGIDVYYTHKQDPVIHQVQFEKQRQQLGEDTVSFGRMVEWLGQVGTRQSINTRYSSYRLKHVAEDWLGDYMGNGTFIAAAIARGFRWQRCDPTSPNVYFNMAGKDLARLEEEAHARKWAR